jgi:hypothetical protein
MTRATSRVALRLACVVVLACASLVVTPGTAHALFHLMNIREVFAGTSTVPAAQFVELQMYAENQRFLAGHEVVVFDAAGTEIQAFTFTSPVANGANQSHVLVATEEAEAEFDVTADLAMTPVIPAGGGRVCFRSSVDELIDCASWGSYSGDDAETGTPFNAPVGLVPNRSMERVISGGMDEQALDEEDDTNDSEADFELASPSPTSNAEEASPPPAEHERTVTLALKGALVARGKVTAEGDFESCFQDVAVRIQRRAGGRWKVAARTTTGSDGTYEAELRDRPGKYRALAPALTPSEGHRCLKAVSRIRRNR